MHESVRAGTTLYANANLFRERFSRRGGATEHQLFSDERGIGRLASARLDLHALPVIDPAKRAVWAVCAEVCHFGAVIPGDETHRVDSRACEGHASCFY